MYYLTCEFKDPKEFIEVFQLISEYGYEVTDFGSRDEPPKPGKSTTKRKSPSPATHMSPNGLLARGPKGYKSVRGTKRRRVATLAATALEGQKDHKLKRSTLTSLIAKEMGDENNTISAHISALIKAQYLVQVR